MSALKDVVSLYQHLKSEWTKKPPNLEKSGDLLKKLKVSLALDLISLKVNSTYTFMFEGARSITVTC